METTPRQLSIQIKRICIEIVLTVHIIGINVHPDRKRFRHSGVDTASGDGVRHRRISPLQQRSRDLVQVWLVWLVVFNVPSTARSFRDGTSIYCPLRRTWSSINTPFRPGIEPRAVAWQSITLPLGYASSSSGHWPSTQRHYFKLRLLSQLLKVIFLYEKKKDL